MTNPNPLQLCLLMTGTELMTGDIIDSNSAYLGHVFSEINLDIVEKVTIADNKDLLIEQIQRLTTHYPILFMNGGLGPTEDDLTAEVLAKVAKQPIVRHKDAEQHVITWCEQRGLAVNQANLKQADLPQSATIFPNAPGSAAAFYLTINGCLVIATPGVPSELKTITQRDILPFLQSRFTLPAIQPWQQYQLFGTGESSLQQLLNDSFPSIRDDYEIGFRANFPYVELKLRNKTAQTQAPTALLNYLDELIIGGAHAKIANNLVNLLSERQLTISCAESCTGGLIASELTKVSGSSAAFHGGIVSYSNAIKEKLLGVPADALTQHGAVSETVALAMLAGIFEQTASDYAIAVTGIAGPNGGSDEKPVGTVFIAFGSQQQRQVIKLCIRLTRHDFQKLVATIALDLIRRQVLGLSLTPHYLTRWRAS